MRSSATCGVVKHFTFLLLCTYLVFLPPFVSNPRKYQCRCGGQDCSWVLTVSRDRKKATALNQFYITEYNPHHSCAGYNENDCPPGISRKKPAVDTDTVSGYRN